MKTSLFYIFLLLHIQLISSPSAAEAGPLRKLTRGAINIVTSPVEVPTQTRIYWKEGAKKTDHILVWIFSGFVKGTVNMVSRIGSGSWDVLSFPFEVPADHEPLVKPDYVFEEWKGLW